MWNKKPLHARCPAVVLLPDPDIVPTALGIIRCLGPAHIPIVTFGPTARPMSSYSRYVSAHVRSTSLSTSMSEYVQQLNELGQKLGGRPVLYVSADEHVNAVNRHADLLRDTFRYDFLSITALEQCTHKQTMMAAALDADIPIPKTALVKPADGAVDPVEIKAPYIVKPACWVTAGAEQGGRDSAFITEFGAKALRVQDAAALPTVLERSKRLALPVLVQEEIPGDAKHLHSVILYADASFRIVNAYTCVKIRQYPRETGTACCVRSGSIPEVIELSARLLSALEFTGIANIEFKYDVRDGTYKLIEINPRSGASIALSRAIGKNLPLAAYSCLSGTAIPEAQDGEPEAIWVDEWIDFVYYMSYHRRGLRGSLRSWQEHRKSLHGRIESAFAPADDRLPGIMHAREIAILCLRAAKRRLTHTA